MIRKDWDLEQMKQTFHFGPGVLFCLGWLVLFFGCSGESVSPPDPGVRVVTGLSMCSVVSPGYYYIGAAVPYTGSLADKAQSWENTMALAIDEINQAGGIHGHDLGLVRCDTRDEPTTSAEVVRELVSTPWIDAIVGPFTSSDTLASAQEAVTAKHVMISPASTAPAITDLNDNGFIFRTTMSDAFQGTVMAVLADEKGMDNVFTVFRNDAYGQGLSDVFIKKFKGLGGHTESMAYDEGTYNADTIAKAIEDQAADAVLLISFVNDGAAIIKAVKNHGTHVQWLFTDGIQNPRLSDKVGGPASMKGALGTAPSVPSGKNYDRFDQAYRQKWGAGPQSFTANLYDAVYLLAIAMELADDPDNGSQIRDQLLYSTALGMQVGPGEWSSALRYISGGDRTLNYEGASGPVDFDAHGDVMSDIDVWSIDANGQIITVGCRKPNGDLCDPKGSPAL